MICRHRRFRADVRKQFGGNALVLGQDIIGAAQGFGGAWRHVAKIADWRRDDRDRAEAMDPFGTGAWH